MSRALIAIAVSCAACASAAQSVRAPMQPATSGLVEPQTYLGCWRPRPPVGPLDGVHYVCFERDRYWILSASDWDAARVSYEATSETSWRLQRDASYSMTITLVEGGLSFAMGDHRGTLERPSTDERRAALDRIAKLPTIEALCDRARRCIDAAGARLPDEEDDSDRVLASTCIHDVEDVVSLLRQRGRDAPPECATKP